MVPMRELLSGLLAVLLPLTAAAQVKNGFDLSDALAPAAEIRQGGPPRDGIPAIDAPQFVSAHRQGLLVDTSRVLGVERNRVAKAYPIAILNWHEIVNDQFGGEGIVVSYCPLCGTGMVFRAEVAGKPRTFGVSGLLYNSDVLLYDRDSESLWSQIARQAIAGPLKGETLEMVPASHTSWAAWRARHPDTLVLSPNTGYRRDYSRDPYRGYETSAALYFPVDPFSARYHPKEQVIGLELEGVFKAYPFAELSQGPRRFLDTVAGREITVEFDPEHRSGRVVDAEGREIPTVIAFWFAWSAFHPNTQVHTAP